MTREDALLYFPEYTEECIRDLYNQKLLEFKHKILFIYPSRRSYQLQIKKFNLIHQAYVFLSKINDVETLELNFDICLSKEDVGDSWRKYNQNKNGIKLLLFNSNKFREIVFLLDKLIENERQFALLFKDVNFKENYNIQVSNLFDLMELEAEIDKFMKKGGRSIKDIEGLDSNNILLKEAYRLSLWLKKENNV